MRKAIRLLLLSLLFLAGAQDLCASIPITRGGHTAWAAAPARSTAHADNSKPLHELLGYRGLTLDPTGYIGQGLRPYEPQSGRWLSPDPLGHAASLALYEYCGNDPVNVFDPDGRFGTSVNKTITSDGRGLINALAHPVNTLNAIDQSLGSVAYGLDGIQMDLASGDSRSHDKYLSGAREAWEEGVQNFKDPTKFGSFVGHRTVGVATWETGGALWSAPKAFLNGLDGVREVTATTTVAAASAQAAESGSIFPKGYAGGPGAMWAGEDLSTASQSFKSFDALKSALGSPGEGNAWHHIFEKAQEGRFGAAAIHNTDNVIAIPQQLNSDLNAVYSSIRPNITGNAQLTVRDWLRTKSLQQDYDFGRAALHYVSTGQW